ncbi:hypothetical protein [Alphaproteobacteria bacterium endosymbiont of Tiliacea citrago]|uniref:hypothetical protein n=1 Tax=Alphaproteobacteria bacterium endosymbiont of Tiliacea citrago TaxID=3077944 RepID=UPI00313E85E1
MKLYVHFLLFFSIQATNNEQFIKKALPNLEDLDNKEHFFFKLFKNQQNSQFLAIKQLLIDQQNSIFSFLQLDEDQIFSEHSKKINFLMQLIEIRKLLFVNNFLTLNDTDKKNKILKIKKAITNEYLYKDIVFSSNVDFNIKDNVSYAQYIGLKLEKDYCPVIKKINNELNNKETKSIIKVSSILIMISAASALIYFFILIQAVTIGDKKNKRQVNMNSSNDELLENYFNNSDEPLVPESSCF